MTNPQSFTQSLLTWYDQHGRKNLPWQQNQTPYRVWVSEIMLQQTQVKTVIPYFERFMQAFPDVHQLAAAEQDQVLHYWSGLGYYARGRNLHKAAQIVVEKHGGQFPIDLDALQALPGIGRSTAGAILSMAMHQRATILDGNVKRVFARIHAVSGWPGDPKVAQKLWKIAESYTPNERVGDYTQAIMDLGATLCTPKQPACPSCPAQHHCQAYAQHQVNRYPESKPRKPLPQRQIYMLMPTIDGEVLLQKRPSLGLWGGLWSFLECDHDTDLETWCHLNHFKKIHSITPWPPLRHTFSHFQLHITPVEIKLKERPTQIMDVTNRVWYNLKETPDKGLATPIKRLLNQLKEKENHHEPQHSLPKTQPVSRRPGPKTLPRRTRRKDLPTHQ